MLSLFETSEHFGIDLQHKLINVHLFKFVPLEDKQICELLHFH